MQTLFMRFAFVASVLSLGLLIGCGGGGAGSSGSTVAPAPFIAGTAKVTVDLVNNRVDVQPIDPSGRAVLSGGAITFSADTVMNEGTPARRVLNMKMQDNTGEKALQGKPFKLHFSGFRNISSPLTNLTGTVRASTLFGGIGFGSLDGSIKNATVNQPRHMTFDPTTNTLYWIEEQGARIRMLRDDVVSTIKVDTNPNTFGGITLAPRTLRFADTPILVSKTAANRIVAMREDGFEIVIAGGGANSSGTATSVSIPTPTALSTVRDQELFYVFGNNQSTSRLVLNATTPSSDFVASTGAAVQTYSDVEHFRPADGQTGFVASTATQLFVHQSKNNAGAFTTIGQTVTGSGDGNGFGASFNGIQSIESIGDAIYVSELANNKIRQVALRPGAILNSANYWVSTISGTGAAGQTDGTGNQTHNGPQALCSTGGNRLFIGEQTKVRLIESIADRFTVLNSEQVSSSSDPPVLVNQDGYLSGATARNPFILETDVANIRPWQFIVASEVQTFDFVVTVEVEADVPLTLAANVNGAGVTGFPFVGSANVMVRSIAGESVGGYANGPASAALFNSLRKGDFDAAGNMYFVEPTLVRMMTPDFRFFTIGGQPSTAGFGAGSGLVSTFQDIRDVEASADGNELLVVEAAGLRRMVFVGGDRTNAQNWIASSMLVGATTTGATSASPVTGANARFSTLAAIDAIDANNFVLVDQAANCIRRASIAAGADRSLSSNWTVTHVAGSTFSTAGNTDAQGTAALFSQPEDIAVTPNGEFLVVDRNNSRIRKVTAAGFTTTYAGNTAGFLDGAAGKFSLPTAIAVDKAGYAFIGDTGNLAIRRITPGQITGTVAGSGGSTNTDGFGSVSSFSGVGKLVMSPKGDLYALNFTRIVQIQRIIRE